MTKSRVGQTMGLNQVQDGRMFLLIGFPPFRMFLLSKTVHYVRYFDQGMWCFCRRDDEHIERDKGVAEWTAPKVQKTLQKYWFPWSIAVKPMENKKNPNQTQKKHKKSVYVVKNPKFQDFHATVRFPRGGWVSSPKSWNFWFLTTYNDFLCFFWIWFGFFLFSIGFTAIDHGNH